VENPSSRATYGAPKVNKIPIADNRSEIDAAEWNQFALDVAQGSHTWWKVRVHFPTVAAGTSTPSATQTQYGNTATYYPTSITRTDVGDYTIVYPSSFQNEAGTSETLSFVYAEAKVASTSVYGKPQCQWSGSTITLTVFDAAGAPVDITAGTTIVVTAW
jgi:hypothetical protein